MSTEKLIHLLHNPKCSKSRATLELLETYLSENNLDSSQLVIRPYLEDPLSVQELTQLVSQLNLPALSLVRTKEAAFAATELDQNSSAADLLAAVAAEPILMERPVVIYGDKAAIGRPPENVLALLP